VRTKGVTDSFEGGFSEWYHDDCHIDNLGLELAHDFLLDIKAQPGRDDQLCRTSTMWPGKLHGQFSAKMTGMLITIEGECRFGFCGTGNLHPQIGVHYPTPLLVAEISMDSGVVRRPAWEPTENCRVRH